MFGKDRPTRTVLMDALKAAPFGKFVAPRGPKENLDSAGILDLIALAPRKAPQCR